MTVLRHVSLHVDINAVVEAVRLEGNIHADRRHAAINELFCDTCSKSGGRPRDDDERRKCHAELRLLTHGYPPLVGSPDPTGRYPTRVDLFKSAMLPAPISSTSAKTNSFAPGVEKHFASQSAVVFGLSISSNLEILADAPGQ